MNTAKVADFGASKFLSNNTMTGNKGTMIYTSPEVIRNQRYTEKCDVYSFGIVMYEVFFEKQPFSELSEIQETTGIWGIFNAVVNGMRPAMSETKLFDESEQMYIQLMQECWSGEATERPGFGDIHYALENIQSSLKGPAH